MKKSFGHGQRLIITETSRREGRGAFIRDSRGNGGGAGVVALASVSRKR